MTSPVVGSPSPVTGEIDYNISPSDFRKLLDGLAKQATKLFYITGVAGKLERGKALEVPGIGNIGKREVKGLQSQFTKQLKVLNKYYRARGARRKPGRVGRVNNGFRIPMFVGPSIVNFFAAADLGPLNPAAPVSDQNPALTAQLSFLGGGAGRGNPTSITTSAMLTPLFAIYAKRNQLNRLALENQGKPVEQWNNQFLGADPLLTDHFAATFEAIRTANLTKLASEGHQEDALKPGAKPGKDGRYKANDRYLAFKPNNFRYANFQSIVAKNRFKKADLNPEQAVQIAAMPKDVADQYQGFVDIAVTQQKAQQKATGQAFPIDYANLANQVAVARNQTLADIPSLSLRAVLDTEQQLVSSALAVMREAQKAAVKAEKARRKAAK